MTRETLAVYACMHRGRREGGREGGASREKREREKKVRNLDRFKGAISFLLDGKEESRRAPGGEEGGREEGCKGGGGREGGH